MIKLKNVFLQLKGFGKKKLIIGCSVITLLLVSGIGVYAINLEGKKDTSSEQKVEEDVTAENTSNENTEPVQEQPKEEEKPQVVEQPKVEQNTQSNTTTQNNTDNSENKSTKTQQPAPAKAKSNESTTKKVQPQQNKPITYTSKSLGLSFDMPASWKDKYFINDNGTEIKVYTKHKDNLNDGCGLLFTITSDLSDYDGGKYLDGIGHINREQTLNKRKYHVGGPLDFRMGEDDPLKDLYRNMVRDSEKVLSTLRAA